MNDITDEIFNSLALDIVAPEDETPSQWNVRMRNSHVLCMLDVRLQFDSIGQYANRVKTVYHASRFIHHTLRPFHYNNEIQAVVSPVYDEEGRPAVDPNFPTDYIFYRMKQTRSAVPNPEVHIKVPLKCWSTPYAFFRCLKSLFDMLDGFRHAQPLPLIRRFDFNLYCGWGPEYMDLSTKTTFDNEDADNISEIDGNYHVNDVQPTRFDKSPFDQSIISTDVFKRIHETAKQIYVWGLFGATVKQSDIEDGMLKVYCSMPNTRTTSKMHSESEGEFVRVS